MQNNSNTDVTKLKFLSGTLRSDKQGTYDYMGLLKQGLDRLGVIYPSGGGGTYTFDNGLTKDLANNVQIGGPFTQNSVMIGDFNQPFIAFDMDETYSNVYMKSPAPSIGSAEVVTYADDDYTEINCEARGDLLKSQACLLHMETNISGENSLTYWRTTYNEASIVSSLEIRMEVDSTNTRSFDFICSGEGRSLTMSLPDISAFIGNPITRTIPLSVNGNTADAAGNIDLSNLNYFLGFNNNNSGAISIERQMSAADEDNIEARAELYTETKYNDGASTHSAGVSVVASTFNNDYDLLYVRLYCVNSFGTVSVKLPTPSAGTTGSSNLILPIKVGGSIADSNGNVSPSRSYTPSASGDTAGNAGDITYDASFIYIKTGSGWRRAALSSF
jgi:hypothetical protein